MVPTTIRLFVLEKDLRFSEAGNGGGAEAGGAGDAGTVSPLRKKQAAPATTRMHTHSSMRREVSMPTADLPKDGGAKMQP